MVSLLRDKLISISESRVPSSLVEKDSVATCEPAAAMGLTGVLSKDICLHPRNTCHPKETHVSQEAMNRYVAALTKGEGLRDDFIYYMTFDDYKTFPDPFPRTAFTVSETEARISRYPNPAKPGASFQWDIHGRLLTPAKVSIPGIAVVMIHGGAVNEYEFIFTPDGPEEYVDLTRNDPTRSRAGVAQHMASLGIPVLSISLPGHYSRKPWPPISERRPEFVIGELPGD